MKTLYEVLVPTMFGFPKVKPISTKHHKNWDKEVQKTFLQWAKNGAGSCVLVAVAGAGKTTVAIESINQFTGSVVIMAFNKKIAEEIKTKIAKAGHDWKKAQGGTAHSFALSAYKKQFPNVIVNDKKVKEIVDAMAQTTNSNFLVSYGDIVVSLVSFAKQAAIGVACSINDKSQWLELIDHHDLWNDAGDGPLPDNADNMLINSAIAVLNENNKNTAIIDYNDMIYLALFHRVRFWQHDVVIIDEAQDTNAARRLLARVMLKRNGRLVAIGDPAQAINGFAGADNDALDRIKADFNASSMPLTVSYRCPKSVVRFAKQWASHITAHESAIEGTVTQAHVDDIFNGKIKLNGAAAILCRVNKPLVTLCMRLIKNKIGARIEGNDIGINLKKLANRWARIKTLDALRDKLELYKDEQRVKLIAKKQESIFAALEDKIDCIHVIIEQCRAESKSGG